MHILGYSEHGTRRIGRLDGDAIIPLGTVTEFWADPFAASARGRQSTESMPVTSVALSHAVPDAARILCLGLNYRAHAAEGSFDAPSSPVIFGRWTASLIVDGAPSTVPIDESGLDWEGEVAAVIGRSLQRADAEEARAAVFGYAAFNDLSARRAQKLTAQWTLGKNADASGPMGDIVTADEVGDLREGLRLRTYVNDELVQDGNTRDMIFELGEVIALISRTMTLNPGDVIVTGTPEGVGYVRTPPRFLTAGDTVTVDIERIGSVTTPIVTAD